MCRSPHVGEPVADEGLLAAVAAGGALVENHVAGLHLHVVLLPVVVQHVHWPRLLHLRQAVGTVQGDLELIPCNQVCAADPLIRPLKM